MASVVGIKLIRIEELARYTNLKPLEMSPLEQNLQTRAPHCVFKNTCIGHQHLKYKQLPASFKMR